MPTFEIPDGPTTVELKRSGDAKNPGPATGSIVFNVTNTSADSCNGRLSVVPSGNSKEEWFTIDGDRERMFASGETQTATIKVSAPKEVATGDYPFRLRAVSVADPDNDHAEGPVATAKVPPAPVIEKKGIPWWVWLLIALVVLAGVGAGLYFAFGGEKEVEVANNVVTNNVVVVSDKAPVPDFTGKTVEQAKAAAEGFDIAEFPGEPTGKAPRTVLSQNPAPQTVQSKGSLVKVTFDPGVPVPALPANATFASAPNALRNAKLEPGSFLCDRGSGPNAPVGRVTSFSPGTGTQVASGTKINMIAVQPDPCPRIILINPNIFLQTPVAKRMSERQRIQLIKSLKPAG
jgi:hypothetical protein